MHLYQLDPQSGAGNCVCGMAESHREHPHDYRATEVRPELCICGLPFEAEPHQMIGERNSFLKWFVSGFSDAAFYGYGYDDQRIHPGYEEGVVLGLKEGENMDFGDAYEIGLMLFGARLKEESK